LGVRAILDVRATSGVPFAVFSLVCGSILAFSSPALGFLGGSLSVGWGKCRIAGRDPQGLDEANHQNNNGERFFQNPAGFEKTSRMNV
jgi:hypothetical protein